MNRPRTVLLTGIALVVGGILLAVVSIKGATTIARFVPLIVGVAVCLSGAVSRVPGLYLPGTLISGAGIGILLIFQAADSATYQQAVGTMLISLGGSLCLLPVLSKATGWDFVVWPFVPGTVLVLVGIGLVVLPSTSAFGKALRNSWHFISSLAIAYVVIVFLKRRSL